MISVSLGRTDSNESFSPRFSRTEHGDTTSNVHFQVIWVSNSLKGWFMNSSLLQGCRTTPWGFIIGAARRRAVDLHFSHSSVILNPSVKHLSPRSSMFILKHSKSFHCAH